jgi:hypothetical protein
MKYILMNGAGLMSMVAMAMAEAGRGVGEEAAEAQTEAPAVDLMAPGPVEAPAVDLMAPGPVDKVVPRRSFNAEQITEIRALRAEKIVEGEKAGSPVWSHAKLAAKFGTTAGVISQIVRNRTYKDPEYVMVNDK